MPKEKKFPTAPDKDGFYFASEEEETAGVTTKDYDNGKKVKKIVLSNGRTAIVRQLKGRETQESQKMVEGNKDSDIDIQVASLSKAVTLDGKTEPPEYYLDDLLQPDFIRIMGANNILNF